MHRLDAKATLGGWDEPALVKVACLTDFAAAQFPLERMVLDLRDPQIRQTAETLTMLPWGGFLVNEPNHAPPGKRWISMSQPLEIGAGDVIEVRPDTAKVARRFRRGGNNNILFATERCNSFCVMCSQPPREIQDDWRVAHLCELVELMDKDTASLTITGGEPTLLGAGLHKVIGHCMTHLPDTHLQVLTNGRNFGKDLAPDVFTPAHPSVKWAIPLYGDHFGLHDYIVQSTGAFAETVRGLYALEAAKQRIEIRVVLVKPVVARLPELARFLYRNFPFVEHVAFMGVEPTGFARAHHNELWIDPLDMQSKLSEAVTYMARREMQVSLYNLPLCTLPKALWPFAKRSISDWKQHYLPACGTCGVKDQCGGLFAWVTPEWTSRAIQPLPQGEPSCVSL